MITLKNVLVATDFSEPSDVALTYGRELAARFGATLHVLHVVQNIYMASFGYENVGAMGADLLAQLEEDARLHLDKLATDSDQSGPKTITSVCSGASPAREIVEYAKEHDVNLIVMGTHGRGMIVHLMMGSVAERVVRLAPCPVLTVRSRERDFVHPDTLMATVRA